MKIHFILVLVIHQYDCWDLGSLGIGNDYYVSNIAVHRGRAFLALPRSVCPNNQTTPTLVEISWNLDVLHHLSTHRPKILGPQEWSVCENIQDVISVVMEPVKPKFWILDKGNDICAPKILSYNLVFNNIQETTELTKTNGKNLNSMVIDPVLNEEFGHRAYIGEIAENMLVVFSLRTQIWWKIQLLEPYIFLVPLNLHYLAISKLDPLLYITGRDQFEIFSLNLETIRSTKDPLSVGAEGAIFVYNVTFLGEKLGRSTGIETDYKSGLTYYMVRDYAAVRWDTRFPLEAENHNVLLQSYEVLPYVTTFFTNTQESVYALINPMSPEECLQRDETQEPIPHLSTRVIPLMTYNKFTKELEFEFGKSEIEQQTEEATVNSLIDDLEVVTVENVKSNTDNEASTEFYNILPVSTPQSEVNEDQEVVINSDFDKEKLVETQTEQGLNTNLHNNFQKQSHLKFQQSDETLLNKLIELTTESMEFLLASRSEEKEGFVSPDKSNIENKFDALTYSKPIDLETPVQELEKDLETKPVQDLEKDLKGVTAQELEKDLVTLPFQEQEKDLESLSVQELEKDLETLSVQKLEKDLETLLVQKLEKDPKTLSVPELEKDLETLSVQELEKELEKLSAQEIEKVLDKQIWSGLENELTEKEIESPKQSIEKDKNGGQKEEEYDYEYGDEEYEYGEEEKEETKQDVKSKPLEATDSFLNTEVSDKLNTQFLIANNKSDMVSVVDDPYSKLLQKEDTPELTSVEKAKSVKSIEQKDYEDLESVEEAEYIEPDEIPGKALKSKSDYESGPWVGLDTDYDK